MAFILKDRVKENSTTTGTGNISLGGASATFDTFQSYLTNGDTTYYAIAHTSSGVDEWEVGLGTWNTGNTLSRTTVLAGSSGTSAVNFSAGTKDIFMTYPASKAAVAGEDVTFADITVTGTVDGRDVAADGSKLDGIDTSADVTDATTVAAAGALMKSGGTMTGNLILNADPNAALGAATKQYVDTIASAGIHYHPPVRAEHPSNLNATYNNGSSGVGATLTNAGTNAALVIDSVSMVLNDRVLVANQTDQTQNGVYTVTTVGDGSTAWVLTRSTDTDTAAPSDPDAFGKGDAFFIKEGSTNAGHLDVLSTSGTIVFGTTNIVFSEVAETTVYSGGTGITLTGTTFSIGQDVATSANVTFNQVTAAIIGNVTGNLTGDVTGNADTATALETARTIQVSGDVTGSASFDGTANINITAAVQDDSHAHVISNVDGLQSALDAKVPTSRIITAGNGLTGGGDLSANRTLTVGGGSGITVNANDIAIDSSYTGFDGRYVNVTGDTMTGDLQTTGLYVGTTNTSYDFYNNGTTYLNGATTIDADTQINGHLGIGGTATDSAWNDAAFGNTEVAIDGGGGYGVLHFRGDGSGSTNTRYSIGVGDNQFYMAYDDVDAVHRLQINSSHQLIVNEGSGNQRVFHDGYHPNADKWTTARTLSLSGDASGSVSWDGSANATLSVAVSNDSHTHDGRYYTESEADSRFVNVTGDTMTGELNVTHNGGVTGTSAPSYSNANIELQTSNNNVPAISFHRGGYSATTLYEYDGQLYVNAWVNRAQNGLLLSAGNISSYVGNGTLTVQGTGALGGSGTFTANQSGNTTISISHDDTSSQASVNNSSGTVIQDVTLDGYGHVTGLASVNLDGRYYTESEADSRFVNVTGDTMTAPLTIDTNTTGMLRLSATNSSPWAIDLQRDDATNSRVYNSGGRWYFEHRPSFVGNTAFDDGYHPNADKWTTARTLSLSGDASGSVSWDGSANATLSVTVANDSHSHSNYITSNADDTWSGNISTTSTNGIRFGNPNQSDSNDGYIAAGRFGSGLNIVGTQTSSGTGRQVRIWGEVITDGGNKYWNAGNDGSGSGLDADLLDGIQGASFLRSDTNDTTSGIITFGPNTGWSKYLKIGGNGNNSDGNSASIGPTNGNLHIDAAQGNFGTYLNFYDGTAGVAFGNGGSLAVAWMGPDGDLWKGSSDNSGSKYWHAGNDGSGSGLDADTVDGSHKSSFLGSHQTSNMIIVNKSYYTTATSTQNQNSGQISYGFGYQIDGGWSHPYPDLIVGYHTGMRLGGHTSYGGVRFYADHPSRTSTRILDVGNGNSNVHAINSFSAGGNITAYSSDKRLKENFKPISTPLEKISKLNGCSFDWIEEIEDLGFTPDMAKNDVGLIAQEVEAVYPQAVAPAPFDHEVDLSDGVFKSKSGKNFLTVKYEKLVPLLVEAVKEQQKQIDELKKRLEAK